MSLELKIKNCIIAFPHLNVPQEKENPSEPDKFGARFYLNKKTHAQDIDKIIDFIESCRDKAVKNPNATPSAIQMQRDSVKTTFTDGDLNPNPYTAGKYYFDARNNMVIPLFNIFGKETHDYRIVKQNGVVNILIRIGYVERFKRVSFYLQGVQYIKDGEMVNLAANAFEDESKSETTDVFSDEELNSHIMN